MSRQLGEAIALLDGVELAGRIASRTPTRDLVMSSTPVSVEVRRPLGADAAFTAYINDLPLDFPVGRPVGVGGGALRTGGSSYIPGMPLLPSTAGLSSDMIAGMAMLEGQAKVQTKVGRMQKRGLIRESMISQGYESAMGSVRMGGSNYIPGAPRMPQGLAGFAGLGATRGEPVKNSELRKAFRDGQAFSEFQKLGGDSVLSGLETKRRDAAAKQSPKLMEYERQIAVIRLFRTKIMTPGQARWSKQDVQRHFLIAMRDAKATAQLAGLEGLAGLNFELAGLEGKFGRKLKAVAKKAGKAAGKLAKSAIKVGIRMGSGGLVPI